MNSLRKNTRNCKKNCDHIEFFSEICSIFMCDIIKHSEKLEKIQKKLERSSIHSQFWLSISLFTYIYILVHTWHIRHTYYMYDVLIYIYIYTSTYAYEFVYIYIYILSDTHVYVKDKSRNLWLFCFFLDIFQFISNFFRVFWKNVFSHSNLESKNSFKKLENISTQNRYIHTFLDFVEFSS